MSEQPSAADGGVNRSGRLELVIEQHARVVLSREVAPGDQYVVGRAPECDLCVDDPALSRRHATLDIGPGHLDVLDT